MPETRILFFSNVDELHHVPLLQSAGYVVDHATTLRQARASWSSVRYDLLLFSVDGRLDNELLSFCQEAKAAAPGAAIALVARWAQYVPRDACLDAVIRPQHNAERFLRTIAELLQRENPR